MLDAAAPSRARLCRAARRSVACAAGGRPRARAQAGDRVDVGGAEGAEAAARGTAGGQSYLVAVVERPAASAGGFDAAAGRSDEVEIGVVAVETSTGDILHAQFRCAAARPGTGVSSSMQRATLPDSCWSEFVLGCALEVA